MYILQTIVRSLVIAVVGAANSELLFGNLRPLAFFADIGVWASYVPLLILLDLLVQKARLGYGRIWLCGLVFAVILEAVMIGMIGEGFLMLGMLMLWHATFTITLTFMFADLLFPRHLADRPLMRLGKWTYGLLTLLGVGWVVMMAVFIGIHGVLRAPIDFAGVIGIAILLTILLYKTRGRYSGFIATSRYLPAAILALGGLGFWLGLHIIDIENADPSKTPYTLIDYQLRAGLYGALASITILAGLVRRIHKNARQH